jgi:hypothetical protein
MVLLLRAPADRGRRTVVQAILTRPSIPDKAPVPAGSEARRPGRSSRSLRHVPRSPQTYSHPPGTPNMGVGHGRNRSAHGVRAGPAPGAVGHSLDAGVTYSVVVSQGGAGPCPFGVRQQQRVGRLSGTSVLPPSQDKAHEPTDSREHLFPRRSCCRSRVSLRVLAEQACLRRSRGHALPHLRRVERQATTRRKDTPEPPAVAWAPCFPPLCTTGISGRARLAGQPTRGWQRWPLATIHPPATPVTNHPGS